MMQYLAPKGGEVFVDATIGMGGHSRLLLLSDKDIKLIGIDQDADAVRIAKTNLEEFGEKVSIHHANFKRIKRILNEADIEKADGILADLGVSSFQLDSKNRGFSFRFDAPLDMRMNINSNYETAADLLKRLSEEEIANIIYQYGEERFSRRIAKKIVERRGEKQPVETTFELAELVKKCVRRSRKDKIHPATRTFQALRIAVNKELDVIEGFIRDSVDLLGEGGRFAVISFHSLEDRIVKKTLQNLAGKCFCPTKFPECICGMSKKVKIMTKKPIVAERNEQIENPRARSAKLRACIKN